MREKRGKAGTLLKAEPHEDIVLDAELPQELKPKGLGYEILENFAQQNQRDKQTTTFYMSFVSAYNEKIKFISGAKKVMLWSCVAWISVLVLICAAVIAYIFFFNDGSDVDALSLITTIVSCIATITVILLTVTKNLFPPDEDRHVSEIVKQIHENDIKNKEMNLGQTNNDSKAV